MNSNIDILTQILSWWTHIMGIVLWIMLILYIVPIVIVKMLPMRNLGQKYGTRWALVTGASSGIGKCLAEMLASKEHGNLNLVLVALDDNLLHHFHAEMEIKYPRQQFVKCGVDLSLEGYMDVIEPLIQNLDIGIVVNNAGFMHFGSFDNLSIAQHVAHMECNMLSHIRLAHHFYSQWKQNNRDKHTRTSSSTRAALVFTCSAQAHFLAPYTTIYGATKSFLITFSNSLSMEASQHGIDVLAMCPEYTRTRLWRKIPRLTVFSVMRLLGSEPRTVAYETLKSLGWGLKHRDQGIYSLLLRIGSGLFFNRDLAIRLTTWALTSLRVSVGAS